MITSMYCTAFDNKEFILDTEVVLNDDTLINLEILATDEDKAHGIDRWARLFKSTTWEELKMIAGNNPVLTDASETLFTFNSDEAERRRSQARKEFIAHEKALNKKLSESAEEIAALTTEKQTLTAEIEHLRAQLAEFEDK